MTGRRMAKLRALHARKRGETPEHVRRHAQMRSLQRKTPFKLRPHHAKPVRKRHLIGFTLSGVLFVVSLVLGIQFIYNQLNHQLDANLAVRDQMSHSGNSSSDVQLVRSTLGFSFSYDTTAISAFATISGPPSQSFMAENASVPRAYDGMSFAPKLSGGMGGGVIDATGMVVTALTDKPQSGSLTEEQLRALAARYAIPAIGSYDITSLGMSALQLGGVTFFKQSYQESLRYTQKGYLSFGTMQVDAYIGVLPNGTPLVITINAPNDAVRTVFEKILGTLSTATSLSSTQIPGVTDLHAAALRKPSILTMAAKLGVLPLNANAAALKSLDEPRIVATNAPAVVKLYHVVCGAILYRDQALTNNSCAGDSGTGFFVSSDGYIATNGHVVSSDPKGILTSNLTPSLLTRMLQIDGYTQSEISTLLSQLSAGSTMQTAATQAINKLPNTALRYQDQKDFYVVALSTDTPQLDQITANRVFKETTTLKLAELKAIDYNSADMTNSSGFTHSDIAVLKVPGANYPVTHLGSLDDIVQGMSVTVVGFPSDAESNNLVKNDTLQTTATEGIVSAIREVNGGDLKVVQSDVNIGHGNSGGPAFDQYGQVFGVATYMLGGTSSGDGNISYLRDIKDLRNLLKAHGITLNTESETQEAWEHGLSDFYGAHYHRAIAEFQRVGKLYGPHTLAGRYITIAQDRIAAGDEAQNIWVPIGIAVAVFASLAGLITFVVVMIRHRAHHHLYKAIQLGYIHGPFAGMQAATPAQQHTTHHHAAG